MTHDALLTGIKEIERLAEGMWGTTALRAVVELHKPFNVRDEVLCESCCAHVYLTDWPCETILAIEKEFA